MNEQRITQIKTSLNEALNPTQLDVIDDSHEHAGHEGAKSGGGHFTVRIASTAFNDLSRVQTHRLVYQALGDLMQTEIHALRIEIL